MDRGAPTIDCRGRGGHRVHGHGRNFVDEIPRLSVRVMPEDKADILDHDLRVRPLCLGPTPQLQLHCRRLLSRSRHVSEVYVVLLWNFDSLQIYNKLSSL